VNKELKDMTYEELLNFEQLLFDDEMDGGETWEMRETVLRELADRFSSTVWRGELE